MKNLSLYSNEAKERFLNLRLSERHHPSNPQRGDDDPSFEGAWKKEEDREDRINIESDLGRD